MHTKTVLCTIHSLWIIHTVASSHINNSSDVTTPKPVGSWQRAFLDAHHLDGWYIYDGGKYSFDCTASYIPSYDLKALVVTFFDEEDALFRMIGHMVNGTTIQFSDSLFIANVSFVKTDVYRTGIRFPAEIVFEIQGLVKWYHVLSSFHGKVVRPENSSFGQFHMEPHKAAENGHGMSQAERMALIVGVPVTVGILGLIGTIGMICWAVRKGYLRNVPKSYRYFRNSAREVDTTEMSHM